MSDIATKIKLEGEKEYKSSIKSITQETKTLDAQLKEVASRYDEESDAMKKAEESNELLREKQKLLIEELSKMQDQLDKVTDAYGEDSMEALKLEEQIAKVETQLNTTNGAIEQNEEVLQGLTDTTEETSSAFGDMGDASDVASAVLGSSFTNMGNIIATVDLAGLAGTAASAIKEIGEKAIEAEMEYEGAMANIATATGLTGDALTGFTTQSQNLWGSFSDADLTLEQTSSMVGALNTRFGIGEEQVTSWGNAVLLFAQETGVDATDAVNGIADAMRQWGMETDNSEESLQNMKDIMDLLLVASENCDVNLGTLTATITDQAGSAQSLGMNMEQLVGLLVAYEDAGGDASTMASGLQKSYTKLNDAVTAYNETHKDSQTTVTEAWDDIIKSLENAETVDEALNSSVGDLGVTLEDVFGQRQAQQIANTFVNGGASIDTFTARMANSRGECERLSSSVQTLADDFTRMGRAAQNAVMFSQAAEQSSYIKNQISSGRYAKAVAQPYLFTGEQVITVAETQPEVLVGKNYFDNLVNAANGTNNYGGNTINVVVNGAPGQDVDALADAVAERINESMNSARRAR